MPKRRKKKARQRVKAITKAKLTPEQERRQKEYYSISRGWLVAWGG